jgi:hypothetical protein
MKLMRNGFLALAGLAGLTLSCVPNVNYRPTTGGYVANSITPKSQWRAGGNLSTPAASIDGQTSTFARADGRRDGELIIDMGKPCLIASIVLDHGNSPNACAASVAVATSADGRTYVEQYVAPGTWRVTTLLLAKPVMTRFIRLRASGGPEPWAIAEVFIQ